MKFELPKVESIPAPYLLCHPNVPKPMHQMNPRSMMGKSWWDIRRQQAYAKFNYRCWACGVHKNKAKKHRWLEGHESYIIDYSLGTITLKEIVALCNYCHMGIHDGFLEVSDNHTEEEKDEILDRKEVLLKGVNCYIFKSDLANQEKAKWEDWRLVIEGIKFRPKFRTYEEWLEHYHPNIEDEFDDQDPYGVCIF